MARLSRDEMFMEMAYTVAKRGTCERAQVGAIIVRDNNIIAIGYNGAPAGKPHCDEVGHKMVNDHCTNAIHAEINCLKKIKYMEGLLTLYVTHYPCMDCTLEIIKAVYLGNRIDRIVYSESYRKADDFRTKLLESVGVKVERLERTTPTSEE